jgi:hypothetical protein
MKQLTHISLGVVLFVFLIIAPASAASAIPANGDFDARVESLSGTSVGKHCLLQVRGTLEFHGTLDGEATGTTRALVFASCSDALDLAANPPGTFKDLFKSELKFTGTVNGVPTTANITYQGKTEAGGNIEAMMILSHGLTGVLNIVDVEVAKGGSYTGFIQIK